jgi:hypothetical protein
VVAQRPDWSGEFMAITDAMRALPFKPVMLDGEAVAHCLDGLPDFHRLLGDGQATACFYAFDLLWLKAQDVRGLELSAAGAQEGRPGAAVLSAPFGAKDGEAMFRHACAMGPKPAAKYLPNTENGGPPGTAN